jgi:mRNA interferase RelE/StbE
MKWSSYLAWQISLDPRALEELKKLDQAIQRRVIRFLRERLETSENPRRIGSSLSGTLAGLWKYRVGDYRLIGRIQDENMEILVLHVGHRKNVYKAV